MTNKQALALFEEAGALLDGHFQLSSGLHSGRYLEKCRLFENPRLLEPMSAELARRFADAAVEIVLAPTTLGIILAYEVARHLGAEARFAEREEGVRQLRRGQVLPSGACVLVVDDILTTGGAIRECIEIVRHHDARLIGVGVLGDRSGGTVVFGARLESLLTVAAEAYPPDACPLCAQGLPLYRPGTKNPTE